MIVISPSDTWLKEAVGDCTKSFSVSSPYIGSYLATLAKRLDQDVQLTVLTRTVLAEFASRSSDLDAVIKLAERAGGVLSLSSLHAKTYIVDDRRALITSANATHSGMHRNWECGYELADKSNVRNLRRMLLHGFGSTRHRNYGRFMISMNCGSRLKNFAPRFHVRLCACRQILKRRAAFNCVERNIHA